jgi:hypothetical protein
MRGDLDLEILVRLAVDAGAYLLLPKGAILVTLDEIDTLRRIVLYAEESLNDFDVEVHLMPPTAGFRNARDEESVGPAGIRPIALREVARSWCCGWLRFRRGADIRLNVGPSPPSTNDICSGALESRIIDRADARRVIGEKAVPRHQIENFVGRGPHYAESLEVLA